MNPLLIHPNGAPFVAHALAALVRTFGSCELITGFCSDGAALSEPMRSLLPSAVRSRIESELHRRAWVKSPHVTIHSYPGRDFIRTLGCRLGFGRAVWGSDQPLHDWVTSRLDLRITRAMLQKYRTDLVYGYEDGCANTFRIARELGLRCWYDLPIMYHRESTRIQLEEAEMFPELRPALRAADEPEWKSARKDSEIRDADHIFVASSLTKRSLESAGVSPDRISIIPYGAPCPTESNRPARREFRVLFVGRIGPRKGVHYLLEAWEKLKLPHATLQLIGVNEFPPGWLERRSGSVSVLPSIPHSGLHTHYLEADLLVLPSLVEGFGLVLLEAMAHGVPVLATDHTAAPDFITDGESGFIVPIRRSDVLAERISWAYEHRETLREMGQAARSIASSMGWSSYEERLTARFQELLS